MQNATLFASAIDFEMLYRIPLPPNRVLSKATKDSGLTQEAALPRNSGMNAIVWRATYWTRANHQIINVNREKILRVHDNLIFPIETYYFSCVTSGDLNSCGKYCAKRGVFCKKHSSLKK